MAKHDWIQEANKITDAKSEILTYADYLDILDKNFMNECRPSYEYIMDMLEYFGKNSDGSFKLFEKAFPDSPAVYGQIKVQQSIFQNLINFSEEGFNNKFLLLVGPNGSSKSSIVKKLVKGLEEYSETENGKLYSFSWIFPIETYVKGTLGLNVSTRETD